MKHFLTLCALLVTSLAFGQESCPNLFDSNSNGAVDIEDFLAVLSLFSDVDSDSDGIWDSQDACIDLEACNYAASPTEPCAFIDVLGECGGGCEGDGDGDGICDDVDTCVGVIDECGVCNGPGPTEVVIDDITILYDSVYLPFDNDWYVFPVSADTTFVFECAPPHVCGNTISYQGYDYETVQIGEHCWFAENLRSEFYTNGDVIANPHCSEWQDSETGMVAVYGENCFCTDQLPEIDACDPAYSLIEYGRLYNGFAVTDSRGLCPTNWHVSSIDDWDGMIEEFGGATLAVDALKSTYGWSLDYNGSNSSGFSGMPGGMRLPSYEEDYAAGYYGKWWTPHVYGTSQYCYGLSMQDGMTNGYAGKKLGHSVRCVWDAE